MTAMHDITSSGREGIDAAEVAKFSALARSWWDERGPHGPLHRINPARLQFIGEAVGEIDGPPAWAARPFAGRRALDIGCGGGLVSEPLARMGAEVTGIDADLTAVDIAAAHAAEAGLAITYRAADAGQLADEGRQFDVVTALEIIEHVPHADRFLDACAALTAPGGVLVLSTLNRSWKSLVFGVGFAEYVARIVPRGTHDWRKFVKPSELAEALGERGLRPFRTAGLLPDLLGGFRLSQRRLGINYMIAAVKPG